MITKTLNNKTFIFKDYKEPDYKEIVYDGKMYKYYQGEDQYGRKTYFFDGTFYSTYKKYLLFGPIIIKTIPYCVFTVNGHIESSNFSKDDIRKAIKERVEIINRIIEIKRGEII